ncbi:hypothetical protein KC921_05130 [Candidatus Woesebacteria bacterium]|nr:hypothetical protein [Candidatus Woesebacteria bacterium]
MSAREITGLSQENLAELGSKPVNAAANAEMPVNAETVNKKPTLKELLPQGYPRLLVHGTSVENAATILTQGLAGGTTSANIGDSLNSRFFRKLGGRLVIMKYQEDDFQTNTEPKEFRPYGFYSIQKKSDTRVHVVFDYIGTDGDAGSGSVTSDVCIPPEELQIVSLNSEQFNFLQNVGAVITASDSWLLGQTDENRALRYQAKLQEFPGWDVIPASEGDPSGRGGDNYRKFFRQKEISELLQLQPTDFADFETYQQKLLELYPTEEALTKHLSISFPGELTMVGGGLTLDSRTVVKTLIRQMYQNLVVSRLTKKLKGDINPEPRLLFPDGEDAAGLRRLKQG